MNEDQDWQTETYKGMEVHVSPLPREGGRWDYTVRVAWPGEDSSSEAELAAESGDDADYPDAATAVAAGFSRGYQMVDELQA